MATYRIYIDEVGDDGMRRTNIQDNRYRYFSLTGVILEAEYYREVFYPALFHLKSEFIPDYPDNPAGSSYCLHRKDILYRQNGFEFLQNNEIRENFDASILEIVKNTNYTVISVVIDKLAHLDTYGNFHNHPYYYCLQVILERYVMFLEDRKAKGDVMIEARTKNKDKELKNVYKNLFLYGTNQIGWQRIQAVLTSREIKIKPKEKNIYGLQLADIVAYPSYAGIKNQKLKQEMPNNFGGLIFDILSDEKYHRVGTRIWGIGKKWLP